VKPVALAVALAMTAAAAACVGPGARAGAGVSVNHGGAFVSTGVSGGTTVALSYRETGGALNRGLFTLLSIMSAGPRTRSKTQVSDRIECRGTTCTVTTTLTTTTEVLDTPAELQARAARTSRAMRAIGSAEIPMALELDLALTELGGDTSGWMATWMLQAPARGVDGPFELVRLSGGFGIGSYTFHDRTRRTVMDDGNALRAVEVTVPTLRYGYAGMPLRAELLFGGTGVYARLQADLNLLALIERDRPSPLRAGLGFGTGPLRLVGEIVIGRFRADGVTGNLEAALVF